MKNLQVLEEGQWKAQCIKEFKGIKKLKRKSREVTKSVNGVKSFKVDLKVDQVTVQGRTATSNGAELLDMRNNAGSDALDLTNGTAFNMTSTTLLASQGSSQNKKGLIRAGNVDGMEVQPYGDQRLQPRIMVCQRPPENSYLSVSQVTYSPDPSASPRKRPGETAGVSSEIKAIQQTRRLLANARERTRVHTISAAFEALRKQVPCYSYGQKLSKLAILRIACNYILSLARLADLDYSADHSNLSFSECVEQCTRTLQSEGRSKKRKACGGLSLSTNTAVEVVPSNQ
ncbi:transcription factor ATOH8 isoform X2 [Bombina bombina]|uniref:transcription factor ATOH8 isoform X2 n=1 Tax=Bombina bombina TaxID=8345 RepID=UPI00235A4E72|nr:transcription factor ATOH8 isoform X2 [Bombina bombina]